MGPGSMVIVDLARMLLEPDGRLSDMRQVCQKSPLMTMIIIVISFFATDGPASGPPHYFGSTSAEK